MMKLREPQFSFEQTLDACFSGITGNNALRERLESNKNILLAEEGRYVNAASTAGLHTIESIHRLETDPVVVGAIRKSDLVKMYDQYFVSEDKPARRVYEAILNAAKDDCPFCGGIGTPRNLDHFLPKAHFPGFSVLPKNLVPACRDCNMDGKAHNFATRAEDQIIQPYIDHERFFSQQWIFAVYRVGTDVEPGYFEYFVKAPEVWDAVDRERVLNHFRTFGLARRYATRAAQYSGALLGQIEAMRARGQGGEEISEVLLEPGVRAAPFVNHWQRGMFQAMMDLVGG